MTTTIFALAAAFIVAALYLADPARAGGTTVNFGGPLGSFAAQPGSGEATKRAEPARGPIASKDARAVQFPPVPSRAVRKVSMERPQTVAIAPKPVESSEAVKHQVVASVSAIAALDQPLAASVGQQDASGTGKVAAAVKELSCKKYVPAAGLTITVPCGK